MAISEGLFQFNTGKDINIILVGPNGSQVQLSNVTGFDAKAEYASISFPALDGLTRHAELPKQWTGSFEVARGDSTLDDFFAGLESDWFDQNEYGYSTVYAYISEAGGSTTGLKFVNCSLKFEESGSWAADKEVKQKVGFVAQRRDVMD